ncbi:hypothetical protein KAR91_08885 [Candidatus Pacearchaeota archaeon]|nr:hypothetical protein [Candidatus Pacearchaeota archaeon]
MSEVTAKGKDKEDKVEKLTVANAKKDEKLMKKIDKLEKKDQTKWVKAYVKAYNAAVADGDTEKKAAKAAEKAAFVEVPKDGGKGKKASGSIKSAYVSDRELLAEAGEEVPAESVDDFMMWCEASGITFTAKDEMEIEFTDEEKAILGKATKAIIVEKDGSFVVTIETDDEEDGLVEISVSEGEDLGEEMEDMAEEVLEEGVEEVPEVPEEGE